MQLGELFPSASLDMTQSATVVTSVEIDSRECVAGSLFVALHGHAANGAHFASAAVANGAVAVVSSEPLELTVPVFVVSDDEIHEMLAHLSSVLAGQPELGLTLVGVTGTNGKTSVTTLVAQLARELTWQAASIGTLTNVRTTPASPELFRTLAAIRQTFASDAPGLVAMEVSSHALDQQRTLGLHFSVSAFTNLSHDHLDYHGDMEQYYRAKAQLFTSAYSECAVIWVDDDYGQRLANETTVPVSAVRRSDASEVTMDLDGTTFFWRGHVVNTRLVGDYNVDNALIAMTILSELGANDADIAKAMGRLTAIPGRFELVAEHPFHVIVDYAHTPDGLRRLLDAVRQLSPTGRVITVFGCGGDRDTAKRPIMGSVASTFSDVTIVTSDNPRSENPGAIIEAVVVGALEGRDVRRNEDRRAAIAQAMDEAQPGDVVVIAGKGHEVTQTIGTEVFAFDDRAVARELMKR